MIQAAIFDVDGTLLDSMPIWMDAGVRYLKGIHVVPEENLGATLWEMSIPEGVAYLKEHYHLPFSNQEITDGIIAKVRDFYYNEAPLKPGAKEFLEKLHQMNVPMVIATSSDRSYLNAALTRTGIAHYFQKIFTCAEVGAGKTQPVIYNVAAEFLGYPHESTFVFEDVVHAARSAKSAGFKVIGIYDEASAKDAAAMKDVCDLYLHDFCSIGDGSHWLI